MRVVVYGVVLNYVKYYRKETGLSLRVLAERSGLSKSEINDIENGIKIPSHVSMLMICKGLGLPMYMVFMDYDNSYVDEFLQNN